MLSIHQQNKDARRLRLLVAGVMLALFVFSACGCRSIRLAISDSANPASGANREPIAKLGFQDSSPGVCEPNHCLAGPVASPPCADNIIDLSVALRLAGVSNPTINRAREQIQEALAGQ